jgi:FMN-dependent NADH-azoreductase
VNQLKEAQYILVTTPMYNWSVPAAFKAYIDQVVMVGVLDSSTKSLAGKKVTVCLATGGAYGPGSWVKVDVFSSQICLNCNFVWYSILSGIS